MGSVTRSEYQSLVEAEMDRQVEKWGEQRHWNQDWFLIASEELGEIAKAILENDPAQLGVEMIQLAAVLETWYRSEDSPHKAVKEVSE